MLPCGNSLEVETNKAIKAIEVNKYVFAKDVLEIYDYFPWIITKMSDENQENDHH